MFIVVRHTESNCDAVSRASMRDYRKLNTTQSNSVTPTSSDSYFDNFVLRSRITALDSSSSFFKLSISDVSFSMMVPRFLRM
jgi:hypothetical protein